MVQASSHINKVTPLHEVSKPCLLLDAFEGMSQHALPAIMYKRLRALCNGKTSAFQADDAGSIPAARLFQ